MTWRPRRTPLRDGDADHKCYGSFPNVKYGFHKPKPQYALTDSVLHPTATIRGRRACHDRVDRRAGLNDQAGALLAGIVLEIFVPGTQIPRRRLGQFGKGAVALGVLDVPFD
jgi:hypothetical protein